MLALAYIFIRVSVSGSLLSLALLVPLISSPSLRHQRSPVSHHDDPLRRLLPILARARRSHELSISFQSFHWFSTPEVLNGECASDEMTRAEDVVSLREMICVDDN